MFCAYREVTGRRPQREKVVNSLVYRKDLFSSVFATFAGSSGDIIHTEVNCHCGKRLNYKETFAFSTDKIKYVQLLQRYKFIG